MATTTGACTLILASASPRRQELIHSLGLPVLIHPADVDEAVESDWHPARIVEELALRKAEAVRTKLLAEPGGQPAGQSVIIGSDTIVVLEGRVLGKPANPEHAIDMLLSLQGRVHEVYSGVACLGLSDGFGKIGHRMTKVRMKPMDRERIERYVATGEPLDKAGSYAIQGLGATLVESIEGDYFNVVGLPLSLLSDLLESFGIRII